MEADHKQSSAIWILSERGNNAILRFHTKNLAHLKYVLR